MYRLAARRRLWSGVYGVHIAGCAAGLALSCSSSEAADTVNNDLSAQAGNGTQTSSSAAGMAAVAGASPTQDPTTTPSSAGAGGAQAVGSAGEAGAPLTPVTEPDAGTTDPLPPDLGTMYPNSFFDDFSYASNADAELSNFGWTLRSLAGGPPGFAEGKWSPDNVSFVVDGEDASNQLLRLTSTAQTLSNLSQTEVCHQFKFLEGTYAARVRFSDAAEAGTTTNQAVQTFFTISAPETRDMGIANYSECDFEYLPNGAWGGGRRVDLVTWDSYDYTNGNDVRNNEFNSDEASFDGWHTLLLSVMNGSVTYSIDGAVVGTHGGDNYPESAMTMCFNLWFVGTIAATAETWVEDVDWVVHMKDQSLALTDVEQKVAEWRTAQIPRLDTIAQ